MWYICDMEFVLVLVYQGTNIGWGIWERCGPVKKKRRGKRMSQRQEIYNCYSSHWNKGKNFVWRVIWAAETRCVISMPFGKPKMENYLKQPVQGLQTYDMCPKWQEERFHQHAAFIGVSYLISFFPTSVSILWRICIYIYIHACVYTLY